MNLKKFFMLFLIICIGFFLRIHNHTTWPREGATFDEYAWTWLGMNIIQAGKPISWSPHPQYKIRTHYVSSKGTPYFLVEPYLEHPPLFGLIAGTYAIISGAQNMHTVDIHSIRGLAVLLGILSICMVFILTKELYGVTVALVASFFYAIIPTIVVGSRIVQNENFFIPCFLLSLYATVKFIKTLRMKYFYISAIVCGLLTLAKVPWWAAGISSFLLLLHYRHYEKAFYYLGIVAVFFSLYFLWGWYWDFEVFMNLWKFQLHRYDITFDGIFSLFTNPTLVDRLFLDGWIYVGWLAFFMLFSEMKKHIVLIIGLLGYFAIYILGIPNEPGHGWYRYPFYPFLVIALAIIVVESIKNRSLFLFFFYAFVGISLLQHTWKPFFGFSYGVYRLFLIICGITGISIFFSGKFSNKISTYSNFFLLVFLFFLSIWTILRYNEQ
ncbi:MAG: glycosyltransferase family 39 protein [Patescibacteria group bacterium]|nr:glycosyltransferase family 39 protein [Patescibacteria group bacterium]